ncbi:hypothetical protein AWH63_11155 [Marinobacter sp. C18]|uniref:hypothetical protein n=1 Tax=Marinobacter sp. C18 TaxID=1772288 RepID=UPI000948D6D8|nr:hypothetical protein [Marinobacter sp. C18]OLF82090.1 hypothetical protein AWH63_11155 [Marinobacter sp. C18]
MQYFTLFFMSGFFSGVLSWVLFNTMTQDVDPLRLLIAAIAYAICTGFIAWRLATYLHQFIPLGFFRSVLHLGIFFLQLVIAWQMEAIVVRTVG